MVETTFLLPMQMQYVGSLFFVSTFIDLQIKTDKQSDAGV